MFTVHLNPLTNFMAIKECNHLFSETKGHVQEILVKQKSSQDVYLNKRILLVNISFNSFILGLSFRGNFSI